MTKTSEDGELSMPPDEACPACGSQKFELRNDSRSGDPLFADVHCAKCGRFIRIWNSV